MKKTLLFFAFYFLLRVVSAQHVIGADFRCEGPFELSTQSMGFINAVYVDDSTADLLYAGSLYGGLWKGEKKVMNDSFNYEWKNISDTWSHTGQGVAGMVIVSTNGNREIFIGTQQGGNGRLFNYGNGILKSSDEGKTWVQVGPRIRTTDKVIVDYLSANPENSRLMFARIGKNYFVTTNAWETYDTIFPPLKNKDENMHIADLEWKPGNSSAFYISTRSESGVKAELFYTPDLGKTWKNFQHGIVAGNIQMDVIHRREMEDLLFIAYADNGAYVQVFNGKNWSSNKNKVRVFSGSGYWNMEFEVNEMDTSVMYLSMTQIARSKNGGKSFETITEYLGKNTHADVRDLHLIQSSSGGSNDVLLMANDGGVSLSEPGIATTKAWKNCNGIGLAVAQFWGISTSENEKGFVAGGGQDNGLYVKHGNTWKTTIAGIGDGYDVCISDINPNYLLAQGNSPSIHRSENGGKTWLGKSAPQSKASFFRRPMVLDEKSHRVYLAHHHLFSIDNTNGKLDGNWIQKSFLPDLFQKNGMLQNNLINAFALNGNSNEKCLIAYESPLWGVDSLKGKLFFTQDISKNEPQWMDVTNYVPQLNWREVYDIVADETNENSFFALVQDPYSGFEAEVIRFEIPDAIDTVYTSNITGNLPKIPRSKLIMEKNSGGNLYVATDSGVFVTNTRLLNQNQWRCFSSESHPIPLCTISDMEINELENRLYVATYGRGLWSTPTSVFGDDKKVVIKKNTIWNKSRKIDSDLVIRRGKFLEIKSEVYLSEYARIVMQKGSRIILSDNGLLRNNDGSLFNQIKIQRSKNCKISIEEKK